MELKRVLVRSEYEPDSSSASDEFLFAVRELFAVMVLFRAAARDGVADVQWKPVRRRAVRRVAEILKELFFRV
jgi:hypothetical protein